MNNKSLRIVLGSALVAAPLLVNAQLKVPAPGPAPAAGTPTPAAAPAPVAVTPEHRAAIKELLDSTNARDAVAKAFSAISQTLAPRMGEVMNRQIEVYPGLTPEQKAKVREGMNPPFEAAVKEGQAVLAQPKLIDDTLEKMIPIYASHFTVAEARQLTAFYKTPLGSKTLTVLPQASGEALQAAAALFSPRINTIIERTVKTQADAVLAQGQAPAKK